MLGGCTSINGMIYMRGQAADYDHWRQLGNAGWGWDDVLPYFRRSEDNYAATTELHGAGGEWTVARQRLRWDILEAFRDAAEEIGIPRRDDFNDGDNEGSGYFEVNQRNGMRWTAAKAFLRPVRQRPNLRVVTGALVTGLMLDDRRATGVRYRLGGAERQATADAEVILAAGAINTPKLLELSGIGDPEVLAAHGHRRAPRAARGGRQPAGPPADPHGLPRDRRAHPEPARQQRLRQGRDRGRVRAPPHRPDVDGAEPARHLLAQRRDGGDGRPRVPHPAALDRQARRAAAPVSRRSPSRSATSAPRAAAPATSAAATRAEQPSIRAELPRHRRATARVAAQGGPPGPPARWRPRARRATRPRSCCPAPAVVDDAELLRAIGDIATTIFHPVGTCRMGRDATAVVDDRLRVHGLGGLRVVDASVMPTIVSGNTASPVIMIAEKAADLMRE